MMLYRPGKHHFQHDAVKRIARVWLSHVVALSMDYFIQRGRFYRSAFIMALMERVLNGTYAGIMGFVS